MIIILVSCDVWSRIEEVFIHCLEILLVWDREARNEV